MHGRPDGGEQMIDGVAAMTRPLPTIRPHPEPTKFRILFVCTGNLCRSPFAELAARQLLERRSGGRASFVVASAGVRAATGRGLDHRTVDQLRRAPWRMDAPELDAFVSRQLDTQMVEQADLILTMTARHRDIVIDGVPRAMAKVFVLRELARIVPMVDVNLLPRSPVLRARSVVAQSRMSRSRAPLRIPTDDDIEDPIGRRTRTHRRVARAIGAAVETIVNVVTTAPPPPPVGQHARVHPMSPQAIGVVRCR